jgi:hypothetical protein
MLVRLAISAGFWKDQSFDAAGAAVAGASETGAGVRAGFGAGCFFAAASDVAGGAAAGRGDGDGAFAAGAVARGVDAVVTAPGSGVMMLTGGVEAALGKSALVGLPVGTPGTSAATGAAAGAGGTFHVGAYREIRPS